MAYPELMVLKGGAAQTKSRKGRRRRNGGAPAAAAAGWLREEGKKRRSILEPSRVLGIKWKHDGEGESLPATVKVGKRAGRRHACNQHRPEKVGNVAGTKK